MTPYHALGKSLDNEIRQHRRNKLFFFLQISKKPKFDLIDNTYNHNYIDQIQGVSKKSLQLENSR